MPSGQCPPSVQYVEPMIPAPDAAALADARAARRRDTVSISRIMRGISGDGDPVPGSLWIAMGDSLAVSVHESRCQYDSCIGETLTVGDSLWTLDDTSVASLRVIARLTRDILVTRPLVRIALSPRPDGVPVGETIQLRVRAIDDQGHAYENAPARITVNGGRERYIHVGTSPIDLALDAAGTRTVVARVGSLADTLTLRVAPAPR